MPVGEGSTVLCGARRPQVYDDNIKGLSLRLIESERGGETERELSTCDDNVGFLW